jgi:hypothetical protein
MIESLEYHAAWLMLKLLGVLRVTGSRVAVFVARILLCAAAETAQDRGIQYAAGVSGLV